MTYAYDDYVQMPTKDLYDTAVMKMAIEAAKDMYDKGQAQMENFYKTYGDFMSPFAKDMEQYSAAMNNVRQTVNDAYARGIDLFKSPEGRAIVAQLSHSIDPMWYNIARQNAKVGYAYLDAVKEAVRKGEYDEGLENFILNQEGGLGSFANFSSEGGRIWDRTAPSRFQDINQWTHHLFDNMELSYDPELSKKYPGYLAYSKNKDVMNTIAANNIATLAGTDLGKYMISRYEDQFKTLGYNDADATKAAVDMLQKNIVNANWEQGQVKLEKDPYEYLRQEYDYKDRNEGVKNGTKYGQSNQYSIAELIRRTSSTRIVGQQTQEYGSETLAKQRDEQIKKGLEISKLVNGHSNTAKGLQMFKNVYQDNSYSATALTDFIANQGFEKAEGKANTIIVPKHQLNRLFTLGEIASRTTGFRGQQSNSNLRKLLKDADIVRVTFTGGNYGAYMKNATNQNYFECIIETGKRVEYNPTPDDPTKAVHKYEWTPIKTSGSYFDSHITSQKDDPRLGYLGTVDKKGKVTPTPNMPITNSQDTKYQDAVMSDVYTTSQYVKGSDYNTDASYTELTGYPYNNEEKK